MRRRKLLWQLYPLTFLVALGAMVLLAAFADGALRRQHLERSARHLQALAGAASLALGTDPQPSKLAALSRSWRSLAQARLTVIAADGKVLVDSHEDPLIMENHGRRPEVVEALELGRGQSRRFSPTLELDMLYVALPWMKEMGAEKKGRPLGVIRMAMPLSDMHAATARLRGQLLNACLAVALGLGLLSWLLTRRLTGPLEAMRLGAESFARGELDRRLPLPNSEEMAALAGALNQMAGQLEERLQSLSRQKTEQQAVLESMEEGVLAVDGGGKILRMNRSAARLLKVDPSQAKGLSMESTIRDPDLKAFLEATLRAAQPLATELKLLGALGAQTVLRVEGRSLVMESGRRLGALVVLRDITQLRRLEEIRRDFVANVSHELRTPITSIKGFVETLIDGGLDDRESARRFLGIIERHAGRMDQILEDLLQLSRLEADGVQLSLERLELEPIVAGALDMVRPAAEKKGQRILLEADKGLRGLVSPHLLEQALINLANNAVHYSEEGTTIQVLLREAGQEVRLDVQDQGRGIPREHLPRLFERFYRVDKARSRKEGGTGLGLAIVKHVVQAQGGRIQVESVEGKGSTFSIFLPKPA